MDMIGMDDEAFGPGFAKALEAARKGPVFIGRNGKPTHVMLSHDEYQALSSAPLSMADTLRQEDGMEIEFEPARRGMNLRVPDL